MDSPIRTRFAQVAGQPDERIRLDEAALLIAAEAEEDVDVEQYLAELDTLALTFERTPHYKRGSPNHGLLHYIHEEAGFTGSVGNFYDPRNSYLNRVIDIRRGIPISLALIHLAVGDRLDIPVTGISFPGHFLVRYGDDDLVDPFSGRQVSRADCRNLARQVLGRKADLKDEYLEPASKREILLRMLDNLKRIFWHGKAWEECRSCIERQLLLLPDWAEYRVQLGDVQHMQGQSALAQHTYTEVLSDERDDQTVELVSKRLLALERVGRTVH